MPPHAAGAWDGAAERAQSATAGSDGPGSAAVDAPNSLAGVQPPPLETPASEQQKLLDPGPKLGAWMKAGTKKAKQAKGDKGEKKPPVPKGGRRRAVILLGLLLVSAGGLMIIDLDQVMSMVGMGADLGPTKKSKKKGGKKGNELVSAEKLSEKTASASTRSPVSALAELEARSRLLLADHQRAWQLGDLEASENALSELRAVSTEETGQDLLARALADRLLSAWNAKDSREAARLVEELRELAEGEASLAGTIDVVAEALAMHHTFLLREVSAGQGSTAQGMLEDSYALLDELDLLIIRPGAGEARMEAYASALYNAHAHASQSEDTLRAVSLIGGLRRLTADQQDRSVVLPFFAKALFNEHRTACSALALSSAEALMGELYGLTDMRWADESEKARLAQALFNGHWASRQVGDVSQSAYYLNELRTLHEHPAGTSGQRLELARALFNAHQDAAHRGDELLGTALLDELRALCSSGQATETQRHQLAKALYDASRSAHGWGRDEQSGALLDELRDLAQRQEATDDQRLQLANGLYNAHTVAAAVGMTDLAGQLLEELRELAAMADARHPLRLFLNSSLLDSRDSESETQAARD